MAKASSGRAVRVTPFLLFFWKVHRLILSASNGRLGQRLGPGRQLLLITRGRRSGRERPVALTYVEDAGRWIVVASNAGEDRHPAWWLNLRADPHVAVEVGGNKVAVIATEIAEPERSRLFQRFVDEADVNYAQYQRRTRRQIPVVALEPK
ncbi:MAG: nitroreductase/quinone reductase family protein [Acidimicrobiia bacterium]